MSPATGTSPPAMDRTARTVALVASSASVRQSARSHASTSTSVVSFSATSASAGSGPHARKTCSGKPGALRTM